MSKQTEKRINMYLLATELHLNRIQGISSYSQQEEQIHFVHWKDCNSKNWKIGTRIQGKEAICGDSSGIIVGARWWVPDCLFRILSAKTVFKIWHFWKFFKKIKHPPVKTKPLNQTKNNNNILHTQVLNKFMFILSFYN